MVGRSRRLSFSSLTYLRRLRRTSLAQGFPLDSESNHHLVVFNLKTLVRGTRRSATMRSGNALSTSPCSSRRHSGELSPSYLRHQFYLSYCSLAISNPSRLGSKLVPALSQSGPQISNLFLPQSQKSHRRNDERQRRRPSPDIDTLANTPVDMSVLPMT